MIYHPSYAARVRDLLYVGAPMAEIANLLGVSVSTLEKWRETYPEFDYAWKDGRAHADAKVAASLFKRACGYDLKKHKTVTNAEGETTETEETVHVPGDVSACVFWLTNRRPESWQQKVEHTGGGGQTVIIDGMSEIEAARRIAFALSKVMHAAVTEEPRRIENGSIRPEQSETE